MKNIWEALPKPIFALAPMEAVTDTVFRRVVAKAAKPDVFFSEFTNATGWVHAGEKAAAGRLDMLDPKTEQPVIAQIWGSDPDDISLLAKHCKTLGYKGVDINMGCPVKSATKGNGGAACIENPDLAAKIIATAKAAGLPVSVKTRLAWSDITQWPLWIEHLLNQDIATLTVHLRTKKEMSAVAAHWDIMPSIVQLRDKISPHTFIIGNGDILNREQGLDFIKQTGADGVMIGRGVFSNIFCFEHVPREHSKQELISLLRHHLKLFSEHQLERRERLPASIAEHAKPYQTLKRFYKIYIRDFPSSSELRNELMETNTLEEADTILERLQQ